MPLDWWLLVSCLGIGGVSTGDERAHKFPGIGLRSISGTINGVPGPPQHARHGRPQLPSGAGTWSAPRVHRGFYCVVQYQPDRFRREGVNVGVIVVDEDKPTMRRRFIESTERIRQMFPLAFVDRWKFVAACRALWMRVAEIARSEEAVRDFIKKEGSSALVLLPPLRVAIEDVDAEVDRLFEELVEVGRAPEATHLQSVIRELVVAGEPSRRVIAPAAIHPQPEQLGTLLLEHITGDDLNGTFDLLKKKLPSGRGIAVMVPAEMSDAESAAAATELAELTAALIAGRSPEA